MSKRKSIRNVVFLVLILVLVLVMIFSGLRILESTVLFDEQSKGDDVSSKTVIRDGVEYFPRQDMTVVLFIGIDQEGKAVPSPSYNNPGAADVVSLVIFDETNKTCSVLCLNRDTMLKMPVLGLGGKPAGSNYGQLALSHTYGTGMEDSCENVKNTVSDFLMGVRIDYYVSMRMDAIGIVNDTVGGVTVTVKDDFSAVDPAITKGEFTLKGDQAMTFVRSRKDLGNQLNVSRMERQQEYINGFMKALSAKLKESDSFALTAYQDVEEYIVTDCSVNALTNLVDKFSDYSIKEIVSPKGENVRGEKYYEFHVDKEALEDLVIRLLYAPKK